MLTAMLTMPILTLARAIFFSLFCDRYAVSARTVEPVFALIRKSARYASVMPGGVGDDPCPDEAVAPVGIDMGFVAEHRRGDPFAPVSGDWPANQAGCPRP